MSELHSATNRDEPVRSETPIWPIFICYRQDDGRDAARWLAEHLNGVRLSFVPQGYDVAPKLDVYFDETAPAVSDWTSIHGPALERARAFLIVCSPGAFADFGDTDWVHRELRWWIEHRTSAPVVIDSTGSDDRWVPQAVKDRWPQAQRTRVLPHELKLLSAEERHAHEARLLERIVGGIQASEITVRYEDLERERQLTQRLSSQAVRLRRQRSWLIAAAIGVVLVGGMAMFFEVKSLRDAALVIQSQKEKLTAQESANINWLKAVDASKRAEATNQDLLDALVWMFNQSARFPINRAALSPEAEALVSGTALRLRRTGYDGRIILEGHIARFCIKRGAGDSLEEADPKTPFSQCAFYPSTAEYMLALGDRLSLSLKQVLLKSGFPQDQVRTVSYGEEFPNPERPSPKTAGEWNKAARENNSVVLRLESKKK